jgi:hypothetical protein
MNLSRKLIAGAILLVVSVCCLLVVSLHSRLHSTIKPINSNMTLILPPTDETEYRIKFGFINRGVGPCELRGSTLHQRTCFISNKVLLNSNDLGIFEVAVKKDAVPVGKFAKFSFEFASSSSSTNNVRVSVFLARLSNIASVHGMLDVEQQETGAR